MTPHTTHTPETAAERDRFKAINAAMLKAIEKALSVVSQGDDDDERPAFQVVNEMVEILQGALAQIEETP